MAKIVDGKLAVTRILDAPRELTDADPIECPSCGSPPNGTLESLVTYAEAMMNDAGTALEYTGTTNTDQMWESQKTATLNGLPILVCSCAELFTHPKIAMVN